MVEDMNEQTDAGSPTKGPVHGTTRKTTDDLLKVLLDSDELGEYLEDLHGNERCHNLSRYLAELLEAKDLKKADVIKESRLNSTFGYQILSGDRKASRNKLLQLAFAMNCSIDETQHILLHANEGALYPRNRRDGIIMFCLENGYTLLEAEDELYRHGEATICEMDAGL